jgi:hypothetical protein
MQAPQQVPLIALYESGGFIAGAITPALLLYETSADDDHGKSVHVHWSPLLCGVVGMWSRRYHRGLDEEARRDPTNRTRGGQRAHTMAGLDDETYLSGAIGVSQVALDRSKKPRSSGVPFANIQDVPMADGGMHAHAKAREAFMHATARICSADGPRVAVHKCCDTDSSTTKSSYQHENPRHVLLPPAGAAACRSRGSSRGDGYRNTDKLLRVAIPRIGYRPCRDAFRLCAEHKFVPEFDCLPAAAVELGTVEAVHAPLDTQEKLEHPLTSASAACSP